MTTGDSGGQKARLSEINITPLIDVLLVLLVIFLLAQPLLQRSIDVQIPLTEDEATSPDLAPIVLQIYADGSYRINRQPLAPQMLAARLREIYDSRKDKALFIQAQGEATYDAVIAVMDEARGAGVAVLGVVLEEPEL